MPHCALLLTSFTVACTPSVVAPTAATATAKIDSRPTVVHELLDAEAQLAPTPPEMIALVDAFLDDIVHTKNHDIVLSQPERVLSYCVLIDRVLQRHNFVYPAPGYNPESMQDALRGFALTPREIAELRALPQNEHRVEAIDRSLSSTFHFADDNGLAMLYVAAGERLHIPLTMADMPPGPNGSHSVIVRWVSADGEESVAWDPVWSRVFQPSHEAPFFGVSQLSRDEAIRRRAFLLPMSRNEILGYGWGMVGHLLGYGEEMAKARVAFRNAHRLAPASPFLLNDEAWYVATTRDPAQRNADEAITLAKRAFAIWPCAPYADTLAAAYAAAGQWEDAVRLEQQAMQMVEEDDTQHAQYRQRLWSYEDHHPYLRPPPAPRFRASKPAHAPADQI